MISDTELQQALSNGMDQCLGISATTVIVFLSRSINIYIYLYISHLLFYVNISFFPFFLIPSVLLCSPVCLSLCLPSPSYTPLVTGSLFDLSNGMLKQKNGWGFYFYPIDSR